MWDLAKKEVSSGPFLQREAAVYYKLKHWVENARTSSKWLVRPQRIHIIAVGARASVLRTRGCGTYRVTQPTPGAAVIKRMRLFAVALFQGS